MNNKELLKDFIINIPKHCVLHLVIIRRKKENPDITGQRSIIKDYYISNYDYLESIWEEVVTISELFNARVYLNINPKPYNSIYINLLNICSSALSYNQYRNVNTIISSSVDSATSEDNYFIVDVDSKSEDFINYIKDKINLCRGNKTRIIKEVPTINGVHLICNKFDIKMYHRLIDEDFSDNWKGMQIPLVLKNSNTLLYYKEL